MLDIKKEILYWLGIMQDHAIFQMASLSCKEREYVQTAQYFRDFFANAQKQLKSGAPLETIKPQILKELKNFIEFKKRLVQKLMTCQIEISMTPTFINHMINEAVEFERTLIMPPLSPDPLCQAIALVDLHKVWLADASGHAGAIASNLDNVEYLLAKKAREFNEKFSHLFIKACELRELLIRTKLPDGALKFLTSEVHEVMKDFIRYLRKIEYLRAECKAMATGTTPPLLANHMIREGSYYLAKANKLLAEIQK